MPIHEVIQEKRRALGLTQEQVAAALNVSTPAVSKWETGTTTPDIALLAPLARLLQTDVNTLLGFRESMTDRETVQFCERLREAAQERGIGAAFAAAEAKLREYPGNERLLQTLALQLDGLLTLSELSEDAAAPYREKLTAWYKRLAESGEEAVRNSANYFLANRYINAGEYALAQEVLDRMPDREELTWNMADKLLLQADLDRRAGRPDKAKERLQRALFSTLGKVQILLYRLLDIALEEGDVFRARAIADRTAKIVELLDLWPYNGYVPLLTVALAERDGEECVSVLRGMLAALLAPWETGKTVLFDRSGASVNDTRLMLRALLDQLEKSPECGFLREDRELQALLAKYRPLAEGA